MSYNESLNPGSNYPEMTQSQWDSAPWNEKETPEKEFEVCITQTLSKTVKVTTNDYIPDGGIDDDGNSQNVEHKGCTAAGMESCLLQNILYSKRKAGFVAGDRLMLCTVIAPYPLDILEL